jgi:tight adherence protein B
MLASALARAVHSGASLLAACEDAAATAEAPASIAMAEVVTAVGRGVPLSAALGAWADAEQLPGVDLLVTACRVGHDDGGDLAAALDAVAVSLLDRLEVADEARALASQARSSAWVLAALPPLGAVCFSLLDPAVAVTLIGTPLGWCCLVVGCLLDGAGAWVMRAQVRAAVR